MKLSGVLLAALAAVNCAPPSGSSGTGSGGSPGGTGGAMDAGGGGSGGTGGTGGTRGTGGTGGQLDGGRAVDAGDAGDAIDAGGSGGGAGVLGATPPMGWNSWNTFQCNMNEALIQQIADTFVSTGMQAAGYQYVNIDDCWMDGRDASGKLRWNTSKFPSGIPALADYVHGKGLKLGIYETPNTTTCVGLYGGISPSVAVGSQGHETVDAQTFASWGVDYLKYDKCTGPLGGFAVMRDALRAAGRPIFYSINPGDGTGCPPGSCSIDVTTIANMWRIGFDIGPSWSTVTRLIDENTNLYSYAGPGRWNDPDMMEVGNGLSDTEGRAHFSMWAIMAAPLIAGNDLHSMSAATKTTLTNSEVIAVDQDPMGVQGRLVASPATNLQVWSKTLSGTNVRAVALLNRNDTGTAAITVQWSALGIPAGAAAVRDLWSHTDLGAFTGSYTAASIPSHGVVMLKVTSSP
jgi:alpha-galactosidase